jgi:hypothetical protein
MKFLLSVFVSLIPVACAVAQGNVQSNPQRDVRSETKDAAAQALVAFQRIGRQTNFKTMGFESADEMTKATLGEPLAVFMVELNDLRAYQANSDPNNLLKPIDKVIYPVEAGNSVRSSIVLQKGKEGWKASDFGGANFARLVTRARDESANATGLPSSMYFVVEVPALNAYFLGYRQADKLMLVSLIDDPAMKLQAGSALPAEQLFEQLRPIAQKYNGLPM